MRQKPFNKIILLGKRRSEKNTAAVLLKLKKYLEKKNKIVFLEKETADLFHIKNTQVISEDQFKKNAELMIVVGGDGSLLNASRSAVIQDLPVLGINRGRLGFLTDISPDQIKLLDNVLEGHYKIEKRFLLNAKIIRQNKKLSQRLIALNDFVLLPNDAAHIIEFSISIDDEWMCTQRADGLIISTPTGSTAYALSGGGPILHPALNAVVLVPMFPHKLTSRPVVISGDSKIQITISPHNETFPRLSCDGQTPIALKPQDNIYLSKFNKQLRLVHPLDYQYFSTLRTKLHWENRPY